MPGIAFEEEADGPRRRSTVLQRPVGLARGLAPGRVALSGRARGQRLRQRLLERVGGVAGLHRQGVDVEVQPALAAVLLQVRNVQHHRAAAGQEIEQDRGVVGDQHVHHRHQLGDVGSGRHRHRAFRQRPELAGHHVVATEQHGGAMPGQACDRAGHQLGIQRRAVQAAAPGRGVQDDARIGIQAQALPDPRTGVGVGAEHQVDPRLAGVGDAAADHLGHLHRLEQYLPGEGVGHRQVRGLQQVAHGVLVVEQGTGNIGTQLLQRRAVPGVEIALLRAPHEVRHEGVVVHQPAGGGQVTRVQGAAMADEDHVRRGGQVRRNDRVRLDRPDMQHAAPGQVRARRAEHRQRVAAHRVAMEAFVQDHLVADRQGLDELGVLELDVARGLGRVAGVLGNNVEVAPEQAGVEERQAGFGIAPGAVQDHAQAVVQARAVGVMAGSGGVVGRGGLGVQAQALAGLAELDVRVRVDPVDAQPLAPRLALPCRIRVRGGQGLRLLRQALQPCRDRRAGIAAGMQAYALPVAPVAILAQRQGARVGRGCVGRALQALQHPAVAVVPFRLRWLQRERGAVGLHGLFPAVQHLQQAAVGETQWRIVGLARLLQALAVGTLGAGPVLLPLMPQADAQYRRVRIRSDGAGVAGLGGLGMPAPFFHAAEPVMGIGVAPVQRQCPGVGAGGIVQPAQALAGHAQLMEPVGAVVLQGGGGAQRGHHPPPAIAPGHDRAEQRVVRGDPGLQVAGAHREHVGHVPQLHPRQVGGDAGEHHARRVQCLEQCQRAQVEAGLGGHLQAFASGQAGLQALRLADAGVVRHRVAAMVALQVHGLVPPQVERGRRVAVLTPAVVAEMLPRAVVGTGKIRVAGAVEVRVEPCRHGRLLGSAGLGGSRGRGRDGGGVVHRDAAAYCIERMLALRAELEMFSVRGR